MRKLGALAKQRVLMLGLEMARSPGNLRTPVGKIPRPPWLRCWHLIVASAVDFSRLDGTSIWVRQLSKPGVWSCVLRGWPPPDHGGRSRAVQLRGWYGYPLKEVLVVYLPCATKRALIVMEPDTMEECGVLFSQPRIRGDMLWCFDSFLQKSLTKV